MHAKVEGTIAAQLPRLQFRAEASHVIECLLRYLDTLLPYLLCHLEACAAAARDESAEEKKLEQESKEEGTDPILHSLSVLHASCSFVGVLAETLRLISVALVGPLVRTVETPQWTDCFGPILLKFFFPIFTLSLFDALFYSFYPLLIFPSVFQPIYASVATNPRNLRSCARPS